MSSTKLAESPPCRNWSSASELNETQESFLNPTDYDDEEFLRYLWREYLHPKEYEWVLIAGYIIVFVVALIGNVLVCVAVWKNHHMRTVTNYFIVNLSLADVLVTITCLPATLVVDITETWFFGQSLCKVIPYLQTVSVSVSVLTLSCIALDRWYAICHPLMFKSTAKRARNSIVIIWIVSCIIMIPQAIVMECSTMLPGLANKTTLFTVCDERWGGEVYPKMYHICFFLVTYMAPLCLMVLAYLQIFRKLWCRQIPGTSSVVQRKWKPLQPVSQPRGSGQQTKSRISAVAAEIKQIRARRKTARMLMVVLLVFAICYLPISILNVLKRVFGMFTHTEDRETVYAWFTFSHWLVYANSAANPIIYNFLSGKFREEFKAAFSCCCLGAHHRQEERLTRGRTSTESRKSLTTQISNFAFKLSEDGDCIPYTINRYLRDYQREGAQFLYTHYIQGRGCILGDDMGLGKTVQVISFLAAVLHKKGTREDIENNMPEFLLRSMKKENVSCTAKKMFLIVAPLSVLYNWRDELDTWGYFRVIILHGNKKDNELIRVKQRRCEIALTTYETLRLCLDELNSLEWSAVIVDEAHRIKNPKARVTEVMKALKCNVRFGLTGTILQNNMKELWCVMDWAVPGLLGSRAYFKKQFSDPVEHGQRHTATKRELATGRKAMGKLAKKMSGWFLRRTKTLIKDQLPKKEDRMVYCSLTDFQKAVYQAVLETEDITLILQSSEPCTCSSGRKRRNCCYKTNSQGEKVKTLYFSYLAVLQKVANHVALLQASSTSEQQKTLINRICDQVFSRFPDFVQKSKDAAFETISDPKYSGKMKVLQQLLNRCRKNNDKVLLFSISTKLLDVLQQYCMAAGFDFRRLDGSTKSEERIKIVKEFNRSQDVNICLVSTMAGGLGLNFVGANVVVLFDPTWNPANDLQAIDRAYRIGQCRDVKVLRLISLGTVEEIMYLRQVYKQQLHCVVVGSENAKRYFEAVQGSKEHRGELFGIHNLFKLRSQGSCLTRDILEREGQVEAGIITATTWWKEGPPADKLEMPEEPECQEYRGTKQPAEPLIEEACGLCSDFSDEESVGNTRIKADKSKAFHSSKASGVPGQLTLLQCGFSNLFETKYKAVEDADGNDTCDDDSSDEQLIHHSKEAKDDRIVGCQKSQDSLGNLEHQKKASITNPDEKLIFYKRENTFKQNVSSESENEKQLKNLVEHQNGTESEDSDVIFPTQYTTRRVPKCHVRFNPSLDESDDSEAENSVKIRNSGGDRKINVRGNGLISKKFDSESSNLKSVMKRQGTSDISDESDDIEITSKSRERKQRVTGSLRLKKEKESKSRLCSFPKTTKKTNQVYTTSQDRNSEAVDESSSSDDDLSISYISSSKQSHRQKVIKDRISFSSKLRSHNKKNTTFIPRKQMKFSHERVVSQEQICESVDKFLDGVQEVAYVHSNQNVIGSSKAENHMSRWATRDVFELKQFSQLPANIAIWDSKTFQEKIKKDTSTHTKGQKPGEGAVSFPFYISYPVSQKKKKVHHTGQTTFIIGETPKGIRKKQFEEMASYFNTSSVKEFAALVTNVTSEERQRMLTDFYGSQYPEIKDFFVDSASELTTSAHDKEEKVRNKSEERDSVIKKGLSDSETLSFKDFTNKISQICSPKIGKEKSVKFQNYNFCGEETFSNDTETKKLPVNSTQETDSRIKSPLSKDTTASCSPNCKSEVCERKLENTVKDKQDSTRMGVSRNRSLGKSETRKIDNPVLENTAVGELLGDTSILDDLFKSHGNSLTRLPKKVLSGPMEKAKQRPKDFWDILNEQNDDSLSKLTDLAVIETLCEKVPLATSSRRKEELETSLWKSNEKFLWRKWNSSDTDENQYIE